MAIDSFLYFDKPSSGPEIVGESTDAYWKTQNKKPFELNSYGFGVENIATIGSKSGGAGAGKANFEVFEITKSVDKASVKLFESCCMGVHFPSVFLALRRAGGEAESAKPYLTFAFKFVFLNSVKWSGSGDDPPEESISFAYGALQIDYYKQSRTGAMENKAITAVWSQVLNAPTAAVE